MPSKLEDIGKTIAEATSTASVTLLDPAQTTALRGIRVFDVGQGDCIGLLDQADKVFCYVDYGGLANHPDDGNPANTAKRLPVKTSHGLVSIVLTHWDKDHYYSAVKKNTAAQSCEWVAPRQLASPQAVRFAARLTNAKCWPESEGQNTVPFAVGPDHTINIRKCQPFDPKAKNEDRNASGVAVTLHKNLNGSLNCYMLLPGDCHFDGIPGLPPVPIRTLIAYHHGSKTHWTSKTAPAISSFTPTHSMVYSYGQHSWTAATAKYRPDWDRYSTHTKDVRAKGDDYVDETW
jgi:hypothetical protein